MQRLTLILIVITIVIATSCSVLMVQAMSQPPPVLPEVEWDDPLLKEELQQLAEQARTGTSRDWQTLGEFLLGQGCYSHAELAFRRALETDSENAAARFGLAFSLDRTGRIAASTAEYQKLSSIDAPEPEIEQLVRWSQYAIGKNALREEKAEEAELAFRKISHDPAARYQLAKLLARSGRAEEALSLIEASLSQHPYSLKYRSLQHATLMELGRNQEAFTAADVLERAHEEVLLNFGPEYVEPFYRRFGLEREIAEYNRMLESQNWSLLADDLRRLRTQVANRRSPYEKTFLSASLDVEFRRRNAAGIRAFLKQLQDLGEMNAEMLQLEGAACAIAGDTQQAIELWQRAAQMSPNIPVYRRLEEACQSIGDFTCRDQARAKRLLLEGLTFYSETQLAQAAEAFQESLNLNPDEPQAWFYLGETLRLQKQPKLANEAYQRCLKLSPTYGRAIRQLNATAQHLQ